MKMSVKMILIFFVMILLIVSVNTYYLTVTNIAGSDAFSADRFRNMAANMVRNAEQYITMMDLAIEDLMADSDFVEAFYQLALHGDSDPAAVQILQNKMTSTLYHSPLADNFYRVSVYAENGYFLSNHFDRNDTILSLSDEARELIPSIPYLREVKAAPFNRHIIAPHADPFTLSREVRVFSNVRSVMRHGKHIGYIEIAASVEELEQLFATDNPIVMVRAELGGGSVLYQNMPDAAVYKQVPLQSFMEYTDPNGLHRNVYHTESRWLGMDIFLSQDAAYRHSMIMGLVWRYIRFSLVIALVAVTLVVVISLGLTRSVRLLTHKVQSLPVDKLLRKKNPPKVDTLVTLPGDREIYELEKNINTLMLNLQSAAQNELAIRESAVNARLNALQAQINPHFVYNTLNIISAKSMESGNEDVVELCDQFAQMLRYSTDTRSRTATVLEDLNHARNYLMLLKARYEDGLEYSIDVPAEMDQIVIPKLSLQPLVENAIVHGFDCGMTVRKISIHGYLRQKEMLLEIHDNGQGFAPEVLERLRASIDRITHHATEAPEENGHIGLLNTCWRLFYYSKGAISMEVMNDTGALVRLRMPLPDANI